ncbi:hypothetical protein KKC13_05125 [bacterium]|nr:hypothetical protein [bacterium]MBU1959399.1 hypothetical protein [bacterium]
MPLKLQTPKEISKKLTTLYNRAEHLTAYLNQTEFTITIKFKRISQKEIETNFMQIRDWVEVLDKSPFEVEFQEVAYRSLGRQRMPYILTMNQEGFLRHLSKVKLFENHLSLVDKTLLTFPQTKGLLETRAKLLMEYDEVWEQLLKVCDYFVAYPKPNKYIRELDIEGVDSKFIEQHMMILDRLLSTILEPKQFDGTITKLTQHGFEKKYGLKYDLPTIRFRILDEDLYIYNMSDILLPLDAFKKLDLGCTKVYITENKINGLSFPNVKNAMVIFGLGYGIETLKEVKWLEEKELFYWGDIDTHGFAILSQIRGYFSHVHSLLMDKEVINRYKHLAVEENKVKRFLGELGHLTKEEQEIFEGLKDDVYGKAFRLEQERISLNYLLDRLFILE